jgi:hypothetical protein
MKRILLTRKAALGRVSRLGVTAFAGFGAGVIAASTFVVLTATPALAVTCTAGHGVSADNGLQLGYGNRVTNPGIAVRNTSVNCLRNSNVKIYDPGNTDTWVEVGWYDCGSSGCAADCDQVTSSHVLVYRAINGTPTCKPGTPATPVTSPPNDGNTFKVANPDHDNTFEYFWETSSQGSYFVGFSHGFLFAGVGERHYSGDSAYGEHKELGYLGSAGNWNTWADTSGRSDVADYVYCEYSKKHVASKQTC